MIAYRKRTTVNRTLKTVRLDQSTLDGLDELRRLFHQRWPTEAYPTLSSMLEELLVRSLKRLTNPRQMELELEDFRARYKNAVPHKAAEPSQATTEGQV